MKSYIIICILAISLFFSASYSQNLNTSYTVQMKFTSVGGSSVFNYYDEKSSLEVINGKASLKIDFKAKDPKTAATNRIHVHGSAEGTLVDNVLKLSGSGTISTYESDVNDDNMSFDIGLNGNVQIVNNVSLITGSFSISQDGEKIPGTFRAERKYTPVRLQIVKGDCKISRHSSSGNSEYEDLKKDADFEFGDRIKTGENTRINLVFPDGSVFNVKSNTIIELGQDEIKMEYGEVFYKIRKMGKDFQVVCGQANLGSFGTSFIVSVDKEQNVVVNLLEGKLSVKDKKGKEIKLEAPNSVRVDSKKGLGEVQKISAKDVEKNFESSDDSNLSKENNDNGNDGIFKSLNKKTIIVAVVIIFIFLVFVATAVIILIIVLKKKRKVNR